MSNFNKNQLKLKNSKKKKRIEDLDSHLIPQDLAMTYSNKNTNKSDKTYYTAFNFLQIT